MKPYLIKTSASAALMAIGLCLSPQAYAADKSPRRDGVGVNEFNRAGISARDVIRETVRSSAGEDLGKVKDLVVSSNDGKIAYAVVGSGGVLGIGEKLRAVPFSALKSASAQAGDLTLDVTKAKWEGAPILKDDEIDLLSSDERGRGVFEYYGQDWNRSSMQRRSNAAADRSHQLLRVSSLLGKDLKNAGREVGEIEDVIVDLSSHRASALIDAEDDYVGSNEKYLIGFDQIMRSPDNKDEFSTSLTRAEFDQAKPARDDWAGTTSGYPYRWTGYSYTHGVGYSARAADVRNDANVAARDARIDARTDARTDRSNARDQRIDNAIDRKLTLAEVRSGLESDPILGSAARRVTLKEEDGKIVIRGTAPTRDVKKMIADRVEVLARGWNVDNEIDVKSASE